MWAIICFLKFIQLAMNFRGHFKLSLAPTDSEFVDGVTLGTIHDLCLVVSTREPISL